MHQDNAGPIIVARNITKAFDSHAAVRQVSFDVEPGRVFGLIGPSGCGKTTTIRMLNGVFRPTSGLVHVMGRDPSRFGARERERIGFTWAAFRLARQLRLD